MQIEIVYQSTEIICLKIAVQLFGLVAELPLNNTCPCAFLSLLKMKL
jgi:hypothetical protein